MRIFITGDRSVDAVNAVILAAAGLQSAAQRWNGLGELEFVTGDNLTGIETAVRYLLPAAGMEVSVLDPAPAVSWGKDWDRRHLVAKDQCDAAVLVHLDPMSSSIGKSLIKVWGDDDERLLIVSPLSV